MDLTCKPLVFNLKTSGSHQRIKQLISHTEKNTLVLALFLSWKLLESVWAELGQIQS